MLNYIDINMRYARVKFVRLSTQLIFIVCLPVAGYMSRMIKSSAKNFKLHSDFKKNVIKKTIAVLPELWITQSNFFFFLSKVRKLKAL